MFTSSGCILLTFCRFPIFFMTVLKMVTADLTEIYGPEEYCNREHFNSTCLSNHVLAIERARYGRMQLGRCVKRNLGYLGCEVDVLSHMDIKCSGKQQCVMKVPDDNLYSTQPCPEDTTSYLEVSYKCLPVEAASQSECQRKGLLKRTFDSGYIASTTTDKQGFGSMSCPWLLEAAAGQKLNITLLNFLRHIPLSQETDEGEPDVRRSAICYEIAVIKDGGSKKTILSCEPNKRHSHVYTSITNKLEITIPKRNTDSVAGSFILKYEAIGCSTISVPKGGTVQYISKSSALVKCNATQETWYLTCKNHKWAGKLGNCTPVTPWGLERIFATEDSFPFGILIAVSIGVALGVFFGGLLLAIVIIHSKRKRQRHNRRMASQEVKLPNYHSAIGHKDSDWPSEVKLIETSACGAHHTIQHGGTLPRTELSEDERTQYMHSQSVIGRPRPHFYESPKFV